MNQAQNDPYSIMEIRQDWVLEPEALGSKTKFWYSASNDTPLWLFKYPQAGTGQHWAEKVAAEVAEAIEVFHARVELAVFQGVRGSATESFARKGRELYHGNQVLAGQVPDYDPDVGFKQGDHTLENIFLALDGTFTTAYGRLRAKERLTDYLVFDALIGNTDRHHENWGILYRYTETGLTGIVAPTFDHASSLWPRAAGRTASATIVPGTGRPIFRKGTWRHLLEAGGCSRLESPRLDPARGVCVRGLISIVPRTAAKSGPSDSRSDHSTRAARLDVLSGEDLRGRADVL